MADSTDSNPTPAMAGHARASPARDPSPARAGTVVRDSPPHERSSATEYKILAIITALTDRMAKMESLQLERDESERIMGAVENSIFASALDANIGARPMTIDALMDSPESMTRVDAAT